MITLPIIRDTKIPIEAICSTDSDGGNICFKFRIWGIDAPETGQPYYDIARYKFEQLLSKAEKVVIKSIDKYSRIVVKIFDHNGKDIAIYMLQSGAAWNISSDFLYESAQDQARSAKRGLWKAKNPISPADWRKKHKRDGTPQDSESESEQDSAAASRSQRNVRNSVKQSIFDAL